MSGTTSAEHAPYHQSDPAGMATSGPAHVTRRVVLGAAAAAGAAPLIVPAPAAARAVAAATPGGPHPINPAYEIGPPDPVEEPWTRPHLPNADAHRLAPRDHSAPGEGELTDPRQTFAASAIPFSFAYHDFPVREVPIEIAPYYRSTPVPLPDSGPHDSTGVRMFEINGKLYDHPVSQAGYGIGLVESYRITGNPTYLELARRQAQRLLDRRVVRSNAWFYPYPFTIQVHGTADIYNPPWYSMMAQGRALSLFSRLHKITGATAWRTAADATFASFLLPPAAGQPWGVYVVDNHLWLEEYPHPKMIKGDRTYNGHTTSLFGLYDYWALTQNPDAKLLLQGAMTTTRDVAGAVRTRTWRSKYCLAHGVDSGHYHTTHMGQHIQLYALTGDSIFARIADVYYDDFPPYQVPGTVRFAAGAHTGCKFTSLGQVTATRRIVLSATSGAPSTARQKVWHQPGLWYSISAGALAGYQVQENPPYRYQLGAYAGLGYLLHRPGVIATSTPKAYAVDKYGRMTSVVTTYQVGDPVTVDMRGVLNASQHVHLAEGPYAGRWLPLWAVTRS